MRKPLRFLMKSLPVLAFAAMVSWLCWPGQVTTLNMWLVRPGMTVERAFWFLGEPDEEIGRDKLPEFQSGEKVVQGERFFHWHQKPREPGDWWTSDWDFYVSIEQGVVKETYHRWPSF